MKRIRLQLGESFAWFNATQFLGALNDNVFKFLSVFFLIGVHYGPDRAGVAGSVVATIFVTPFLLFTPLAGKLADRFSKRDIVVAAKTAEVLVMILGCLAFYYSSPVGVCVVLFLMCTQSAFFGPSKFGIIPELVASEQLSRANSFLEGLTYLAIVIGSAVAPALARVTGRRYALAGLVCVAIAAVGALCSWRIERTAPAGGGSRASLFFFKDVYRPLRKVRGDRYLMMAIFASAYFLLIGAFLQINLIAFGIDALGYDEVRSGYLFGFAALGIGAGSYLAGRLSGRSIEFGIVPMGAFGLAFCSILTSFVGSEQFKHLVFALTFLTGVSAGLFIVPLQAFIQLRTPKKIRGEVIAASGFLSWIGVLISAGLLYVLSAILKLSPAQSFFVLGLLTLVLAVVSVVMLPDFLVRFIIVLLARFCYRIKVFGSENVPAEGGALLVSNHVSWADAILLAAAQPRRIRFLVDREIARIWWLRPFCRLMHTIPISTDDPPKKIMESLRQARQAIRDGSIVCIFAEGGITRTGMLGQFKSGFEKIMKNTPYSVIPVYIGGAWGSILSYYHGQLLSKLPRRFPYPVSIHFGKAMPASSNAVEIRQAVMELSCDHFNSLKPHRRSLGVHFVQSARRHWFKRFIADATGRSLKYGQALTATVALSDELEKITRGEKNVGVLLPPSCGAALANFAIALLGKVCVNLSYAISEDTRDYIIDQSRLKCIISTRSFVEKIGMDRETPGLVFLEDIIKRITPAAKVKSFIKACLLPRRILAHARHFNADDPATIVFSSGSTGLPKGVMLSHHNIISNIEGARMIFRIFPNDMLCSGLPFFHSFGLTFTLWLPVMTGVSSMYVPNPLDGRLVAQSVREQKTTILFATPTLLMNYLRRAEPDDFATLRLAFTGAEKLRTRLADSFEKKFGIHPLEGYGTTELSPLVSLNVPHAEAGGIRQVGHKPGTVGHPIPGVAVRIVDPQDKTPLTHGEAGLLLVKGPNMMSGYLNMPAETAQVIQDGWYNTGDIATMDADGFLTITDRLSRFSKIGGEMVPHLKIEEVYLDALGTHEHVVAVTSIGDDRKGEQLVVLYVPSACDADTLHEIISNADMPNVFKPKRNNYIAVEAIPVLGTGKLDIMGLRRLALAAKSNPAAQETQA